MSTVPPDLEGAIHRQVERVLAALDEVQLAEEMARELTTSMPEFEGPIDEDFRAALLRSVLGNVRAVFELLRFAGDAESISPPADATAWAYELVHRGFPIAALLRAYRLGHAVFARRFEEEAAALDIEPELRWRVLTHSSRTFFSYNDAVSTQLADAYEQERGRWIRGAAAARAELVNKIIARQPVDVRAATATLGYDVARCHVAFIVWFDPHEDRSAPLPGSLEAAASALAREVGGGQMLLVPIGERVVWGWMSAEQLAHGTPPIAGRLPDGVRAALGEPIPGLDGMAESHEQARAARRVGEVMGLRAGMALRYGPVALTALLTAEPAQAVRYTLRQLGALAADTDACSRLRATVGIYLEENLSPARTARRLGIHQNTVVYRVRKAEELRGRPVLEGRLELEVALRLVGGLPRLAATQ